MNVVKSIEYVRWNNKDAVVLRSRVICALFGAHFVSRLVALEHRSHEARSGIEAVLRIYL